MKQSFVFYETIEEALLCLPDEDYIVFSKAAMAYGLHGIEPEFEGLRKAAWMQIKFCIDNAKEHRKSAQDNANKRWHKNKTECESMPAYADSCEPMPTVCEPMLYVNGNVNENVNGNVKGEGEPEPAPESPTPSSGFADLQTTVYKKIQEHNKASPVESKIPVSTNLLSFVQKEFRELLDVMKESPPEEILQTVDNLLKSAKEKRKRKYSWWFFLKDINEYRPEYFQEKTGRPADISSDDFFNLMKNKPGFNMVLFCTHEQDWIKAGKPFDDAYFELQRTWEGDSVT